MISLCNRYDWLIGSGGDNVTYWSPNDTDALNGMTVRMYCGYSVPPDGLMPMAAVMVLTLSATLIFPPAS